MFSPRTWTIGLIAVALVGILGGAAALDASFATSTQAQASSDVNYDGYYPARSLLYAGNVTVNGGQYLLGYSADVRFVSSYAGASVSCGLIDPTHQIGYILTNTFRSTPANGTTRHITFSALYSLPDLTIGLRCRPSVEGKLRLQVTNIRVFAEPRQ
ncbi:MAG: hypothetical protein JWR36_1522 [Glaciihabitans sp.]|nr:hypothetical protein [Glaciihabitans sp.]